LELIGEKELATVWRYHGKDTHRHILRKVSK